MLDDGIVGVLLIPLINITVMATLSTAGRSVIGTYVKEDIETRFK